MKKQCFIWGIIIIFLLSLFQIVFAQKVEETSAEESLQNALQAMDPEDEILNLRGLNQRAFKSKDGKRLTFISTEPLNYVADDKGLYPIDINIASADLEASKNTLRSLVSTDEEQSRYGFHALKNSIKAWFANESNDGVKLEYEKYSVEFILEAQNKSKALVNENTIKYKKVSANCDLVYTVLPGRVKDELIFSSIPKTPIISYRLKMNQKLIPQNGPDGSVTLVDDSVILLLKLYRLDIGIL